MCKIVYLTSKCFDKPSSHFKRALAAELQNRNIDVVTDSTCSIKKIFRKHHTYGMAIAIDFFRDKKNGCGLTLNKQCSYISRDFAYNISNILDKVLPRIKWRDFRFVNSTDKIWRMFFDKINSETKSIFYLCTYNNVVDYDNFMTKFDVVVRAFADEIVRCLRSNYDCKDYQKRVRLAKLKQRKVISMK
jgi:hypothetical protein